MTRYLRVVGLGVLGVVIGLGGCGLDPTGDGAEVESARRAAQSLPVVTTSAATLVTGTTAQLNGAANPGELATTGWFRYSTTHPGTCDDTFGTRAPNTGGTLLGNGATVVAYSQGVTGLVPATTYYFCAIAENSLGKGYGAVLTFTTPDVPTVTTLAATLVTTSTATLNGQANPNNNTSYGFFRYSTTNPGSCNDTFGTRAPASSSSDTSLGSGSSPVPYSHAISGLLPGTTYYFCALARNSTGTSFGVVLTFTTDPTLPTVTTSSATLVTGTTAQLNGTGNPGGAATTGWFRFSNVNPVTCNDTFGTRAPASDGTLLGNGTTAVAYSQGVTGLVQATTYYYCAIAENSVGKAYGAVLSFTTPSPPTVTTDVATSVTNTTATLNGAAIPNGSTATGWFRYSLTDPGTCDDVFGSRAPTSGGTSLGSGSSSVPYDRYISGLSAGTTYYYCAIASNAEGLAFGAVLSFTTASAPTVTTAAATLVTATSATLNGSANPNYNAAYGYFRYSTTDPGSCSDAFGTRAPSSSSSDSYLGTGDVAVDYSRAITGLTPGTTYYYCAIARNSYGTSFGTIFSFTTPAALPVVTTNAAALLTGTTAQLNGSANPGGADTTGWFRYATASPGTCNDTFGTRAPATGGAPLGAGNASVPYSQGITGLTAGTTYYYCAIAENSVGKAVGTVRTFVTPTPPLAVTDSSSSVTNTTAYLNGYGTPNGATSTGYFRYSTTDPGTCNDIFGSRAPTSGGTNLGTGSSPQYFDEYITGLSPGATYYFCAIVTSAEGTAFGAVLSFTTAAAPSVTTVAATSVTSYTATINGTANPNSAAAYGYFRYSTTDPGTCTDSFGTRMPSSSSSDTYLGTGNTPVDYSRAITSLLPGATYYYCAIARNSYGTTFGAVLSFTTPVAAPTANTSSASLLTGTTAQLNGSSNPGGADTTAWFRYDTVSPGTCNDSFGTRAPGTGGSAIGAGTSNVPFSQGITGLSPGVVYFYCAIAQNSVDKALGSVLTFTTPTPPEAITDAASSVTSSTAYLNGQGDPNGAASTGYFRYSTTDPGTCDDIFGSRAPASGGTSLGTGTSFQFFDEYITGLSSGTTYYYCAIVTSAEGIAFGSVLSFTTAGAPTVTTQAATSVTSSTAILNGTANPNYNASYGYFRYASTDPGSCSDSFGTRAPSTSTSDTYLGTGSTPVDYSRSISSLLPGTTYYFCAIGRNSYGTTFGAILSFTTPAAAPTVSTGTASSLTGTTAQLNGSSNPGGAATTAWFRYSTTSPGSCNDTFGTRAPGTGGSDVGSGTSNVAFSEGITGLTPGALYYYCAIAENSVGKVYGTVRTFTTPTPPQVTTEAPSSISNTTAYLNGYGTPNLASTTGYFRYSTTNPGTCDDTFGSRAPASGGTGLGSGTTPVFFDEYITGLSEGTTYYYCAIASSAEGIAFGAVLTFTTATAPSVTTQPATSVTATTATLNGTGTPNWNSTYGYFRYSSTNPGSCSDSFGTRAPSSSTSDTYLGAGNTPMDYARSIGSLLPGTTYYYCAIARNSYGTTYGDLLSFTTLAALPTATTSTATLLTGTTAQLNGSSNPGGAATTGWFRYSTTSPGSCNDTFGMRAPGTGGSSLGAGTSTVPFSQGITGLTAGTVYYYCAIAENSVGKTFGSVLTFTTPTPPLVTTEAASGHTNTTVYLNGYGTPNGASTTGYFRYSLTDPGVCDDVFGSRAPTSGGTALGSGTTATFFDEYITGLSPGTTYYFCAIAQSAEGTSFGSVLTVTTASSPLVTTNAATVVTSSSANLNGTGTPNWNAAYGYFRYSTTNPGVCTDFFGTRMPSSSTSDTYLGADDSSVDFARAITSLLPGTTYYFCAITRNSYGTTYGEVLSFTTLAAVPTVSTSSASGVTTATATLNGSANPGGDATTGWFRYGTASPGSCNDSFGTRAPTTGGSSLGAGTSSVAFSQVIAGLNPGTTYYYCAIAENSVGKAFGTVRTFTTTSPPTVTTLAATPVYASTSTLNGLVNPNGYTTTGWFRYSTTNPGACNDSFGIATTTSSIGSGTTASPMSKDLTGLTAATTYYFCAIASSAIGTSFGVILSFTTSAAPPTVTTDPASDVANTSATLWATVNPNGADTTAWFRYSTTNPGTCNDTFGTREPLTGGAALGDGSAPVPVTAPITSLVPGTTYYYCALAWSAIGNSVGEVRSFTTPAVPVVTTSAATSVTSTGATLNGSANPFLSPTTGYFRYDTANPGSCNDTFGTRAPASGGDDLGTGSSSVPYSEPITGLTPGTTYYFCAIAENTSGPGFGTVLTFTTPGAPSVTTESATGVTSTGATLHGQANPNLAATTGYFRYATTDPGSCNDTFGTRAPTSGGSDLGNGSSPVGYSHPITGLVPGTTYYVCAIAQNSWGTGVGTLVTFTTPATPTVTTLAASGVTSTAATLGGTANPNLDPTTGYFRYDTTNPGSCNDTFGLRAPASGGDDLGAGSSPMPYSEPLTGLAPGTTYYFCAIAQNSFGAGFGAVLTFTTAAAPSVTTLAAQAVTPTGASLGGEANPNLVATTGWFRYDTTAPGSCNDTFGVRAPLSGGDDLGAGASPVPYSEPLTGLTPGATYYYCAIAQNASGTAFGAVLSFTTPAAPSVTTAAATDVTSTGAILEGSANPNLDPTTGYFRYDTADPGSCNDTFGVRAPLSGGDDLGAGASPVPYSEPLTGLAPGTTYYVCAIAVNGAGVGFGTVLSFTTPAAPSVTSVAATDVTSSGATLQGSATPNLEATLGYFRYDTTDPGSCDDTFGTRAPASGGDDLGAGTSPVDYSEALTGLAPGTTYYYCAVAQNSSGTSFGAVLSFTTPATPTVSTEVATLLSGTGATLRGTANPNLDATTGYFRYALTDPGACDDTFGVRAPTTGGADLGAGSSPVAYSQAITGLAPGTTYYFCAVAQNSSGTSFGAVLSVTTPAAPAVSTLAPTNVASAQATLRGEASPNLSSALGYFRYDTTDPVTCNDTFGTRAPTTSGTDLGAGVMPVAYQVTVTGLTPGVTYYYCAIAQNVEGTAFGTVLSFTTSATPTVTTQSVTALGSTGATLQGSANPNLSEATGYFRYGTTDPGSCDDSFGTRAPASGGSALGAGSSPVGFSEAVAGLAPGTTYYYCAIATNASSTGFGAVLSFTTPAAPTVATQAATDVTSTGATLRGSGNPNLDDAIGYFRYGTTDPGSCDDSFGTRAPASGGSALGAGQSPVDFSQALTGLAPGTTYYYCAIATSASGTGFGAVLSFATPAAPTVTTLAPTLVTQLGATLQGSADPNGSATTAHFRYHNADPGACNDSFGTRAPASGGVALGAGQSSVDFSEAITGLAPGTTYYFCAIAVNAEGTGFGAVQSFTTAAAPDVTTLDATGITSSGATLNGTVDPNLLASTGWFRYDTTDPGACNDTFGTRTPATGGTAFAAQGGEEPYSEPLTGLFPGRTYYFCAIAENAAGKRFGAVLSLTTAAAIPSVTTNAPTSVEAFSALLNGAANPNGDAATGWFRLDTTDPGACNDTFGSRLPASSGTALGGGTVLVAFSESALTLAPGTRYYFCAIAQNAVGTGYGEVLSFVAGTTSPTVTTEPAMDILATSATMAGSANPNGTFATGWFRFGDTDPGTCSDAFGARVPGTNGVALGDGLTAVDFTQPLDDLEPARTYYYCAAASNSAGAIFGEVLSFTTAPVEPEVETVSATVLESVATMTGAANPMGSETTAWLRYDSVAPSACDDTFGVRVPASGGQALGAGRNPVGFTEAVPDLAPGIYYYCAIAGNEAGTGFGDLLVFEVPEPPIDPPGKKGGCDCRTASDGGTVGDALFPVLALLFCLLFLGHRRQRQRQRQHQR